MKKVRGIKYITRSVLFFFVHVLRRALSFALSMQTAGVLS